jgi:hypothetical protein
MAKVIYWFLFCGLFRQYVILNLTHTSYTNPAPAILKHLSAIQMA